MNETHNDAGNETTEHETDTSPTSESSAELAELRGENEELKQNAPVRTARDLMTTELNHGARSRSLILDSEIAEVQLTIPTERVDTESALT